MNYESSSKAQSDYYNSMNLAEQKVSEKEKIEVVKNLITKLGLSDKEAANVANVSVALVKLNQASIKKVKTL